MRAGGRAVGVRLPARSGEPPREIRADVVLSNADLKRTLCELVGPEHLPSGVLTKARDYKMAAARPPIMAPTMPWPARVEAPVR